MASTYSDLKIELIGTGEQAGTWGNTTNTNLGTALEQAIVGKADINMNSTTITLTLTNSNAAQDARALYLNLTGSPGGAADLVVPALQKSYLVKNGTTGGFAVTIKVTGQTGVSIPNGKTVWVYNNGTDVVTAVDHIPSLTLGAALPVASGGTGITSFGTGVATFLGTPSSANLATAVTDETGSGALVFATSPTLVTPALGTPASGVVTNLTGTASININGTVGATTPTTGSFTNVNVTGTVAPATGMYQLSTASSGLSFQNASAAAANSTAMQIYFGKSTIPATTNGVTNNDEQFFAFGKNNAPRITIPSDAAIYDFAGHNFLTTDVPFVMRLKSGGRGDNTSYTSPVDNGVLYVDLAASYGGNDPSGNNGIYVTVPRLGLGGSDANGIKVLNRAFDECKGYWSLLKPDDPNGSGTPVGFFAQIDTSNTLHDNSSPVGLRIDNATTDNYAKTNGGAPLAQFFDRRSGSTSRQAATFRRNTTGNEVGSITTTNTATAYNTSSDYRLKENVVPMTGALAKVLQLKPCTFTWKKSGSNSEGFIAHELAEVCLQAVTGTKDAIKIETVEVAPAVPEIKDEHGNIIQHAKSPTYETKEVPDYQGIDTSFLVATLTAAIQELKAELDSAKQRIAILEAQ